MKAYATIIKDENEADEAAHKILRNMLDFNPTLFTRTDRTLLEHVEVYLDTKQPLALRDVKKAAAAVADYSRGAMRGIAPESVTALMQWFESAEAVIMAAQMKLDGVV